MPNLSLFVLKLKSIQLEENLKNSTTQLPKKSFGFALVSFLYCVLVITLVDTVFNEWHVDEWLLQVQGANTGSRKHYVFKLLQNEKFRNQFPVPFWVEFYSIIFFSLTYNHLKILHVQASDALNKHFLKSNPFDLSKSTLKTMHNFHHLS